MIEGEADSVVAEWTALSNAIASMDDLKVCGGIIKVKGDCSIVLRQLNGTSKTRSHKISHFRKTCCGSLMRLATIKWEAVWMPRYFNQYCNHLANVARQNHIKSLTS